MSGVIAKVAAEEGPMNLLRECVTGLEAEADGGWSPAAKSHLSKARVALNMLPAPANESYAPSQRLVYVAMSNTDLTEGRGRQIPIAVCEAEATAIRLAKKAYVMGTDAPVDTVSLLLHESQWYAPIGIVRILPPTQEDTRAQDALNAHRAALEKALAAGLTDEDIKALGSRQ